MIAPRIEFSDRAERFEFGGKSAVETFADYIDGKTEFSAIASTIWKGVH